LLLARNVALTQNYIDRLKQASIQCVYIEDEISEGIEPENVVSQELKLKSVNVIQNVFKQATGKKSVGFDAMQVDQIKDIIDEMMEIVFSHRDTLYVMAELMGTDMYTYNHSAEVAVLSMLVKMKIPNEVLNKITPLSDEEMKLVKEHARFGYDILKESVSISPISRQIILLHHEKLDGNGYPMRLTADEIPVHVRISANRRRKQIHGEYSHSR
jgi:HD-GYP domain-containing protein (c-di-GMP phosphodiesterase class II)